MAIIRKHSKRNVVDAARLRVENIFKNGLPVYLSFSAGKDSLALAGIVYELIEEGRIDAKQLTVNFIDEEGIFPCIEDVAKEWRKKFMMVGAKFNWWCIQCVHFNCLNELETSETFICWDETMKDRWIRPMPKYAIKEHPLHKAREESYQKFLEKYERDGISLVGVRVAESVQRLINVANKKTQKKLYPIYDWKDSDVWKYLRERNIRVPDVYEYLWRSGVPRSRLRVSQFFSSDTVGVLVKMNEFMPDLMERVTRREPNAYMVSLYWDTEMFRRSTSKRRKTEGNTTKDRDYQKEVHELLANINQNFPKPLQRKVARNYKKLVLKSSGMIAQREYRKIYDALLGGDPKLRSLRAIQTDIYTNWRKKHE